MPPSFDYAMLVLRFLNLFDLYVITCGFKNGYQKTCAEWRLDHVQSVMTVLISTVSIIGGHLHNCLMSTRAYSLIKEEIFV